MQIHTDPKSLNRLITARISRWEFVSICFAIIMSIGYLIIWHQAGTDVHPYDLKNYLNAANGDFSEYYYGPWILPIISLLNFIPVPTAYIIWSILNIAGVFFTTRLFGGNVPLVIFSYQMLSSIYFGQIIGIVVGCIGLLWWSLSNRKWWLAGIAFLFASVKIQSGFLPGLILLAFHEIPWREKLKVLFLPGLVLLITFIIDPSWLGETISRIHQSPPDAKASIDLWKWFGPFVLIFWIPPFVLKMERFDKLITVISACTFAVPYFQQADLLILFTFPIGFVVLFGNLGYLFLEYFEIAWQILFILPLFVYLKTISKYVSNWHKL